MNYTKTNIFLIVILWIGFNSCGQKKQNEQAKDVVSKTNISLITAAELNQISDSILIIDVRTPEEFASGHIENSININMQSVDFMEQIATLEKGQSVYLYCKKGGRSNRAARMIQEMEFKNIYDLKGGILQWEKEGYKTIK